MMTLFCRRTAHRAASPRPMRRGTTSVYPLTAQTPSKLCVFWIGCTAIGSRIDLFNYGVEGTDWQVWAMMSTPFCSQWGRHSASHPMNWRGIHSTTVLIPPCRTRKRRCWNLPSTKAAMRLPRWRVSPLTQTPIAIEIAGLNSLYAEYYTAFGHVAYGAQTQEKIDELHTRSEAIG